MKVVGAWIGKELLLVSFYICGPIKDTYTYKDQELEIQRALYINMNKRRKLGTILCLGISCRRTTG